MSEHVGDSSEVKDLYDNLPKDYSVAAIIRCGDKTERYIVKKTDTKPYVVNDNEMTFDGTTLELSLHAKKSIMKIRRPNRPIELALHTPNGRVYLTSEDGVTYKSSAEGSVKVAKAARGQVIVKSGSDICVII